MKKLILLSLIFFVGCSSNLKEIESEEFYKYIGSYNGTYINENDVEQTVVFQITSDSKINSSEFDGEITIYENNTFKGKVNDFIFEGNITDSPTISGSGTFSGEYTSSFSFNKVLTNETIIEEEKETEKKYNYITEYLEGLTDEIRTKFEMASVTIPGGYIFNYETLNENVMGTPSNAITTTKLEIHTSSNIDEIKNWVYTTYQGSGWRVFEEHDFDDGYGSFIVSFINDATINRLLISASEPSDYSYLIVKFD